MLETGFSDKRQSAVNKHDKRLCELQLGRSRSREHRPLHSGLHHLNLVGVLTQWFRAFRGCFTAFRGKRFIHATTRQNASSRGG
jgi:hypothetical protein